MKIRTGIEHSDAWEPRSPRGRRFSPPYGELTHLQPMLLSRGNSVTILTGQTVGGLTLYIVHYHTAGSHYACIIQNHIG